MDLALHARAEAILTEHRTQWAAEGKLEQLPEVPPEPVNRKAGKIFLIPKPGDTKGKAPQQSLNS